MADTQNRNRAGLGRRLGWGTAALVGIALLAGSWFLLAPVSESSELEFTDVRAQTEEFHRYYEAIELTAEQQKIFETGLSGLPAPCCSDESALTCCCECNMGRSWWGLSKHLIAERGYDAEQVAEAVQGWFEFINPDGFTGNACYSGGCFKPFRENGCGGMMKDQVIH